MNWQTVPLGTLADFRNGINYTKKNFGKGIKVIHVRNFQDYSYATFDDLDEVNLIKVIKEEDLLEKNDIIFVRSNGNRQLIGRSLFVSDIKEKVVHSAFTIKVRFNSEKVIPKFYAYLFRTSLIRQTLSAHGNGTNISNLNQQILSNLPVPLPALSTQNKIVNIISAYDDLIENNTRRIKVLETMAQTLYQEWFVKFRFPGHEQVKMVESELGLIPEGWEVINFTDIADILNGGTPKTKIEEYWNGDIPFFTPKDSPNSFYVTHTGKSITELGLKKCNSKLYSKNTIFITARGTVGKTSLAATDMAMNQSCFAIRGKENISQYFVFLMLRSYVEHLKKTATGATFNSIVMDTFKRLQITEPPVALITEFSDLVSPLFEQMLNLIDKNNNLRKTRDLLLPKLISGQIDVENLDIDTGELAA